LIGWLVDQIPRIEMSTFPSATASPVVTTDSQKSTSTLPVITPSESCQNPNASTTESNKSKFDAINTRLRCRMLNCWFSMQNSNATFRLYEKQTVSGVYCGTDGKQTHLQINNLTTPVYVYPSSLVRTSDILICHFEDTTIVAPHQSSLHSKDRQQSTVKEWMRQTICSDDMRATHCLSSKSFNCNNHIWNDRDNLWSQTILANISKHRDKGSGSSSTKRLPNLLCKTHVIRVVLTQTPLSEHSDWVLIPNCSKSVRTILKHQRSLRDRLFKGKSG